MLAKERQNSIQKLLQRDGAVTTAGLVKQFDVSVETIRRDFLVMEQNGQLTRVHGGAVAGGEMTPFLDLEHRNKDQCGYPSVRWYLHGDLLKDQGQRYFYSE